MTTTNPVTMMNQLYSFDGTDVQGVTYVLRGLRVAIPTVTT
jgi:hypothetical protein